MIPMTKKLLLLFFLFATLAVHAQQPHWVGTWACAPQMVDKAFMPYNNQMTDRSVRQVVKVSIGGSVHVYKSERCHSSFYHP